MPATERIRLRVRPREGVRSTRILDAIKEYASQETRNPWPRAHGVRYSFERDEDGVSLVIAGGRARLGLAYAMTMLANSRFSDAVSSVEVRLPATTPAARRR
ncbi:MAG: hypothetical protein AUH85_10245 [Chloroflexi bacterium 13_1_40CM_4_68_4]|nr:MAG: hypothetical protein AUH85_10245 [Chloroflexi bacterium 13_1_40CM_4_68_4]